MERRAVQTLVVILNDQLPVGLHVIHDPMRDDEIAHSPGRELFRESGKLVAERRSAIRKIDEDEAVPHVRPNGAQRELLAPESGRPVHVRRADQPSLVVIRPRVIRALNRAAKGARRLIAQLRAAMAAHVVKRPHAAVVGRAHDDQRIARDAPRDERAALRQLAQPSDADPHAAIEALLLAREQIGIGVVARRQREGRVRQRRARFERHSKFRFMIQPVREET
jgi:hypothetical protein